MIEASAPGKLILCGEHAVVYGRPAIALPLENVCATVKIQPEPAGCGILVHAPQMEKSWVVDIADPDPLSELIRATLAYLKAEATDFSVTISSAIPIASGMGSGAAVAVALIQALAKQFKVKLTPKEVAQLANVSEQRYHGTPSGIDNAVIAYQQAIWFVRSESSAHLPTIEPLTMGTSLNLVIGDTGLRSPTHLPVGKVRERRQVETLRYETIFNKIGALVKQTRGALNRGNLIELGLLLNENQILLEEMGVSSPELERLVTAAHVAGALGAKLSGGGWGGVMFALTTEEDRATVAKALRQAGAAAVLETRVSGFLRR